MPAATLTAEPLPTVQDYQDWLGVGALALDWAEKCAAPAWDLRQSLRGVYTPSAPVSVYWDVEGDTPYVLGNQASRSDVRRVKSAVATVGYGTPWELCGDDVTAPDFAMVKVAYSPFLRRAGELLNFFPGKYPGGIPNYPKPLGAMLTTGLVGAGLGYGAGWLGEQLLPNKWRKGRLRTTLAALGGAAGAIPGAVWGGVNMSNGLPFNDNRVLNTEPGATPQLDTTAPSKAAADEPQLNPRFVTAVQTFADDYAAANTAMLKEAWGEHEGIGPNEAVEQYRGPLDVNVDSMGRLLWESGADPRITGMTMGALAAAGQMPGGDDPGLVTPAQVGNLALHMGAGWLSGALVGSALGALTGMPEDTQQLLRRSGVGLGIVRYLVPRLFSQ